MVYFGKLAVSSKEEDFVEGENRGRGIHVNLFQRRAYESPSSWVALRIGRKRER